MNFGILTFLFDQKLFHHIMYATFGYWWLYTKEGRMKPYPLYENPEAKDERAAKRKSSLGKMAERVVMSVLQTIKQ